MSKKCNVMRSLDEENIKSHEIIVQILFSLIPVTKINRFKTEKENMKKNKLKIIIKYKENGLKKEKKKT